MRSTRSLRSLASRSARTLPAKPAPTINQSYIPLLRRRGGVNRQGRGGTIGNGVASHIQHELVHGGPCLVPGSRRQMAVDLGEPALPRSSQDELRLFDQFFGAAGDLDQSLLA